MVATINIHSIQDIGRLLFGKKELGWFFTRVDIEMGWNVLCWKGKVWNFQVMYGMIEVILLQHSEKANRCIWEKDDSCAVIMGRRDKMLWFEYKKKTNIFCVATFSVALLNIVLNIIFLDRYFNDTRELFQDSGLNYGHVALCNSLIILRDRKSTRLNSSHQ